MLRSSSSNLLLVIMLLASITFSPVFASSNYFFPQTAAGNAGDLRMLTQFSASNPTQRQGRVTLSFYDDAGAPLTLHTSCPENQTLTKDGSELSFLLPAETKYTIYVSFNGAFRVGWTVVLSEVPLQISATYGLYQQQGSTGRNIPLWEAAVVPAPSAHELVFAVHKVTSEMVADVDTNTGFAIANPSNWGHASVTARLHNTDGSVKSEKTFTVVDFGHRAQFLTELFSDVVFTDFRGVLTFSSNTPLVAVALKESKSGATIVYSTVPVQTTPELRSDLLYEMENNGDLASAQLVHAPAEIRGAMNAQGGGPEPDLFAIDLTAGQTLQILALGSFTGSPLNPILSIRDSTNVQVAAGQAIMTGSTDAMAAYSAAAGGRYYFRVTSQGGAGRTHSYRLFVRVF
ncbi:MAG: hypothetical protein EHM61_16145 [Acidobacteria bacterium]|nr:MAG: hypothetical protein EHM61_16145 [Acidobacteriota bacterium]